jgi:hypothetical protein
LHQLTARGNVSSYRCGGINQVKNSLVGGKSNAKIKNKKSCGQKIPSKTFGQNQA